MATTIDVYREFIRNGTQEEQGELTINSLPNKILIKIFLYLRLDDRNSVSLVCKRWFELVSTQPLVMEFPFVLKGDFKIDAAPISVLLNSKRKFPYLMVDTYLRRKENLKIFAKLLDTIGQNVVYLYINDLHLDNDTLDKILYKCSKLITLRVSLNIDMEKIRGVPKSLKTIIFDYCNGFHYWDRKFDRCKNYPQEVIVKEFAFTFYEFSKSKMEYEVHEKFMKYANRIPSHPARFEVYNFNIKKDQPLRLEHINDIQMYGTVLPTLEKFTNLETLFIPNHICANFHRIIIMPKLKSLYLKVSIKCIKCFDTMLDSFPNLATLLVYSTDTFTQEHLDLVSAKASHLRKLILRIEPSSWKFKSLKLNGLTELKDLELAIEPKNFPVVANLPKLKNLIIKTSQRKNFLSNLKFGSLTSNMENLTSLTLSIDFLTLPETKGIFEQFSNLKIFKLEVEPSCVKDQFEENRNKFFKDFLEFVNVVIQHGKCLTTLELYSKSYKFTKLLSLDKEKPEWIGKMFSAMDKLQTVIISFNNYKRFTRYHTLVIDENFSESSWEEMPQIFPELSVNFWSIKFDDVPFPFIR